jgi:tRNA/tmRNA/rRNA uracil-C5-methylase (TrmA/RlmC/RlmD family)
LGNEVVRKGLKALIVSLKTGEKSSNFPKKSHIRVLLHDNGNKETVGIIFIKEERSKIVNFLSEILSNADFAGWQIKKFHNVASRFDDSIIVAANGEQQVYHRILNEDIITTEPTVFSQVNPETSVILRTKVMEVLPESGEILDLYGGYGAFALQYALQKKGKSTVVESSLEAVEAGKKFAKERKLAVEFIKADLDRFDLKALEMKRYDATILDPPRKGTHPKVMKVLNEFGAPTIVYISCHPAALARDLRMLTLYKAKCFIPLDLFPNTPDLETIALLERRK